MIEKISLKYYLISVFIPIICIVLMFGYATKYISEEIVFIKQELVGLTEANKIHSIVIYMQRLRGIINLPTSSEKYNLEKKQYIYETKNKINILRDYLNPNEKKHFSHQSIYIYLSSILQLFETQHNFSKKKNFDNYSKINENSFDIQKEIALHTNLILDPIKESYLLMETIILQLPKLIEFNGQLRALLLTKGDYKITKSDFIMLSNRISKINDLSKELSFNINNFLKIHKENKEEIEIHFNNAIISKNNLSNYILSNFKENLKLSHPEIIYEFFTTNINNMIKLYNQNSLVLESILKRRLENKINIRNFIVFIGIISIFFILFNFFNYFRKNKDLIKSIHNSNKILKEQSITDGLTKLYNRRYFDIIFEQQLNQSERNKSSFVFMLCDIDYFKSYNDTYGHILGDETLKKVAGALKESLKRPNDYAFRIGGEEFGIVLSDMTFEKASGFAKTIKYNVENLNIEHKGNENNNNILTISMGITHIKECVNNNSNDIYNSSDEALYKSKENGRNQISINKF